MKLADANSEFVRYSLLGVTIRFPRGLQVVYKSLN